MPLDWGTLKTILQAVTVDLVDSNTTSESRIWYKDLIKRNLIEFGFSGWMADFGEYSPINARTISAPDWWGQDHGEIVHQVTIFTAEKHFVRNLNAKLLKKFREKLIFRGKKCKKKSSPGDEENTNPDWY
jgi:hypothetical protein